MSTLTAQQIAGYAQAAGFTGQGLTWAVAVALAESGGNAAAQHTNTNGSVDRGLWQINSRAHPEVSSAQAFDPAQAARAAFTISKGGTSWTPWTTAKNGAAQAMLGTAALAASKPIATGSSSTTAQDAGLLQLPGQAIDGVATAGKSLAALAGDVQAGADWFGNKHNWSRIALYLVGGIGALAGLVMLGQADLGGPVGTVASKAATGARAAGKTAKLAGTAATAVVTDGASLAVQGGAKVVKGAGKAAASAAK